MIGPVGLVTMLLWLAACGSKPADAGAAAEVGLLEPERPATDVDKDTRLDTADGYIVRLES